MAQMDAAAVVSNDSDLALLIAEARRLMPHRLIGPVRLPGKAARAFRAGANLAPELAVGHRRWEDFLAERMNSSSGDDGSGSPQPPGILGDSSSR